METEAKTKKRTFRKLGFTQEETEDIVSGLNILLANYHVHYQKLRNFHWNVEGGDFFDLHDQFEEQYNQAKVHIDDIAERIRVFDRTPTSTLQEYLQISDIEEVGTDLSSIEMVREILRDFEVLLSKMVDVANAAIDIGDLGTEDLINSFIKKLEKDHWMLNSWVKLETE